MSNRAQFTQVYAYGEVTNDAGALEIVAAPGAGIYVYIEKMYLNVYEAAVGGNGIVQLKDTDGTVIMTTNVDGVKDLPFDFGSYGWRVPAVNTGLQFVVSGAGTKQASVSVTLKGHLDNK